MLNVIEFPKRVPRPAESGAPRPAANAEVDSSRLASHFTGLQSKARGEIGDAILMLDLAAQHARQIAKRACDPRIRKDFDEHIAIIERLLRIARGMAMKL